jgi:RNA polymerase sigma-70 factor (ECF subfamily)
MPDLVADFEAQRGYLLSLAYRMLGTQTDAEDVVQEAFLRWRSADRAQVQSPRAFQTTTVTRLCIDRRREIEARKESYVGPWLPEPIVEFIPPSLSRPETAESVSLALLHVLESLSPAERAAYLLRVMFDYEYAEIAAVLDKSEPTCRQLVSRAQAHVQAERPRFEASADEVQRITDQFLHACATGDLDGLVQLLHDDAVMLSDGGGKVAAARVPLVGADRISRFFVGLFKKALPHWTIGECRVNGAPGRAVYLGNKLDTVMVVDVAVGRIQRLYLVRNPDKLARAVGDAIKVESPGQ